MTKALPFTENAIQRAVTGARKAGLKVSAFSIAPDGTLTLFEGLEPPKPTVQNTALSKWADTIAD